MPSASLYRIIVVLIIACSLILFSTLLSCEGCGFGDDDDDDDSRYAYSKCSRFVEILTDLYLCYGFVYDSTTWDAWDDSIYQCNSTAIDEYASLGGCLGDYPRVQYGVPYTSCITNICGNAFAKCHTDCAESMDAQYDQYCSTEEECSQLLAGWSSSMFKCTDACF
jgi:hypothetical protein